MRSWSNYDRIIIKSWFDHDQIYNQIMIKWRWFPHLVVLRFASNHSECVVDEVVVDVHLQHNSDDDVEDEEEWRWWRKKMTLCAKLVVVRKQKLLKQTMCCWWNGDRCAPATQYWGWWIGWWRWRWCWGWRWGWWYWWWWWGRSRMKMITFDRPWLDPAGTHFLLRSS